MPDPTERLEDRPDTVMATVYLRSRSGRSLLEAGPRALTNPRPYRPDPATVERAVSGLEELGFTVEATGLTLSISGPPGLFERASGATISFELAEIRDPGRQAPRPLRVARSSEPVMRIKTLEKDIEGIVLAVPGVPFGGRAPAAAEDPGGGPGTQSAAPG